MTQKNIRFKGFSNDSIVSSSSYWFHKNLSMSSTVVYIHRAEEQLCDERTREGWRGYTFYWWKLQSRLHFWTRRPPEKCWANRLNEYTIYFQWVSNKMSSSQHSEAERGQRQDVTWKGCQLFDCVKEKKLWLSEYLSTYLSIKLKRAWKNEMTEKMKCDYIK